MGDDLLEKRKVINMAINRYLRIAETVNIKNVLMINQLVENSKKTNGPYKTFFRIVLMINIARIFYKLLQSNGIQEG